MSNARNSGAGTVSTPSDQGGSPMQARPEIDERDLEWVRRLLATFPPDALERLTRADYDYYSTHGEYLPGLARIALYYRSAVEQIAETSRWYADNGGRDPLEVDHALCVEILSLAEGAL